MVNTGGMQRESTFHADTVGNTTNGEGFPVGAVALGNHSTLKRLKTFAAAFHNLNEYPQGIADVEAGQIGTELRLLDRTDDFAH